jgi:site-specific DNA-methyltransferase (cytosine-N4-specific)
MSYCASPRHTEWAVKRLLACPFTLTKDRLSTKVFGEQSYTTSHFTHGLHQYKGKFFPRMVRALLNAHRPNLVLDPFCGSGTLQAEATSAGYNSAGFDLNPLAVNICNMKAEILAADSHAFDSYYCLVAPQIRAATVPQLSLGAQSPHSLPPSEVPFPKDLAASLGPADLRFTNEVKAVIKNNPCPPYSHILLMVLSDALKSKVRVRVGGKTAFFYAIEPNQLDLRTKFRQSVTELATFLQLWGKLRDSLGIRLVPTSTYDGDARSWPELSCTPDLVITSPPYFPYTGISYVYTNLAAIAVLGVKEPRSLEERMIGNTLARQVATDRAFADLPQVADLYSFLEGDKYRRARIPVYADYFRNLSQVFRQMKSHCAPGANVRFVVAKSQKLYRMHENRTLHEIDCVAITRKIAELGGLVHVGQTDIPLFKSDKVSLFPSNEGVEVVLHLRT